MITYHIANAGGKYREETLEGRPHLVCDAVMIVEGVHEGSEGPIFYDRTVMNEDPGAWDHMPIVIDHPTKKDGKPTKAREATVLNKQKIGILLNTVCKDGKLKTECWFDKNRLKSVDSKLFKRIEKGEKIEVSTGLRIDMENSEGEWNGEKYIGIARKFYPDHLAVLPNGIGACSTADGAGLYANSAILPLVANDASFSSINGQIYKLLRETYEEPGYIWNGYLEDVYDGYFVYYMDKSLHRQDFKITDDVVSLVGEPQEVIRTVQYRTVTNNEYVGNCTGLFISNSEKKLMDKQKTVDAIVANSKGVFKDADKTYLLTQDEARLTELNTIYNSTPAPTPTPPVKEEKPITPNFGTPVEKPTLPDILNNSDPAAREQWEEYQADLAGRKDALVSVITQNGKSTVFTKEELLSRKISELRKMAELVGGAPVTAGTTGTPGVDYGAAGSSKGVENAAEVPTLSAPLIVTRGVENKETKK